MAKKKPVKKAIKKPVKKTSVKRPKRPFKKRTVKKKIPLKKKISVKKKRPVKKVVIKKIALGVTGKKAYNKWNYTKQKNKKATKDLLKSLAKKDENTFIKYEGKRRKVKTVLNYLKLKAVKNNTKITKEIGLLEKKFKRKIRPKKKKQPLIYGIIKSPPYFAWETKQAKEFVSGKRVAGNDFYLPAYYMSIDAIVMLMTSGDKFQMTYNRKDENPDTRFSVYILG